MSPSNAKLYYKEYFHEGDREYKATDAVCWDVTNCRVQSGEVMSEAGINMYMEHPDSQDLSHWWMYVKGFEYICCIPKCEHSQRMLWWTPTLEDCPEVPNGPFAIIICVLKPHLLEGYKKLRDKYVGLIGQRSDHSLLAGLLPCLCPGPNGMETYEPNQKLMGAFTEKFAVAQQFHAMGILVWLIRPSFRILPTMNINVYSPQQHDDAIVLWPFSDGWGKPDPYPVLVVGPPSTELYRWMQHISYGIMDLQDVTLISRQDFIEGKVKLGAVWESYSLPVPSVSQLSVAGAVGPIAGSSSRNEGQYSSATSSTQQGKVMLALQVRSLLKVFAVLRSVRSQQLSQPRSQLQSQAPSMPVIPPSLGLMPRLDEVPMPSSFKYPKPEIFLNSKNWALYTATWLAIRAHHVYTLGTGTSLPPPISSNFLIKIQPFLHPESIDVAAQLDEPMTSTAPPQLEGKGKQSTKGPGKGPGKSRTKKLNSYLDQIPLKQGQVDRVVFYDTTIQLGTTVELENTLTPEITKEVLWELCHMSFQFKLEKAAAACIQEVLWVFPMSGEVVGPFIINEIPNRDLGLTSVDLLEWNCYLVALGHLMSSWKGCLESITKASLGPLVNQIPLPTAADLHDDAAAAAVDTDDNGTDWDNGDSEDSEGVSPSEGLHPLVFPAEQGSPMFFEKLTSVELLAMGLFPASPLRPTLAVDLNMLDYVNELFVRLPPNTTACYKLESRDAIRHCFGNALQWYGNLIAQKELLISGIINESHTGIEGQDDLSSESKELDEESYGPPLTSSPAPSADEASDGSPDVQDSTNATSGIHRPSLYLRQRCPLCFGGDKPHDDNFLADVIVCIDACFTHKRRNPAKGGAKGPENLHSETVFVSDKNVAEMKAFVETTCPVKSKSKEKTKEGSDAHGVEDSYEPGMKVPVSALEGCLASFVAADERRTKASTQFFADTGLTAMLCCHDHVLWIVNMTTAGEQQYYALALIKELFLNLPLSMTVGILYDIGLFHAYGHQWPCQLIYHHCKGESFGLSDGEGCERFWSSIKLLIPSMRVAEFYHLLFTIDTQVKHLEKKSFKVMGKWLQRKWLHCLEKKIGAEEILQELGLEMPLLEKEWKDQVVAQTKPLARQSKNIANNAVKEIMALYTARNAFVGMNFSQITTQGKDAFFR
ncbi:uncharacterized protein LACBIDRAFT_335525 [Laccaria bicolor S238N-H82]|uniref:Predicted protein n=1 Tax=Laccaria bicolor (strain S238N-H82 / ATCC MYA-4686) TaxID=486041 RepID=B0E2J3_LACBS|nr:uncharacterized protein LACBIDRAFT_335525 [Laccaria bicolor S238N-H82]EDQ98933.1 predicted protein [Laccaria bicolor S238N-H82]|eukprot:XP_001890414.1 predicted protein [Laccaria bicolor S238N-H82]